jgi:glycosyltransferase involved in cell wall biosynthesis
VYSILAQSYDNIEIIIVDDRSTDNTLEVVNELKGECPYIMYCRNDRAQGPSGARNTGLARSTGDYVSFLDSDDVWLEGHLAKGLAILAKNPEIDVLFGNFKVVEYQSGKLLYEFFDKKKVLHRLSTTRISESVRLITDNLFEALIQENFFHLASSLMSRKVLTGVAFDERVTFAEDADFPIQIFIKNHARFAYRTDPVFILHRHGANLTEIAKVNTKLEDAQILLFTDYLHKYAEGPRQKALLRRKISESMLDRSYMMRSQGKSLAALLDLIKSSLYNVTPAHFGETAKILGSVVTRSCRGIGNIVKPGVR